MTPPPDRAAAGIAAPDAAALEEVFRQRHGDVASTGWAPRLRHRFGYFTPDEVYEAMVARLVMPGAKWLDVGCGRDLFPSNRALARQLADRCGLLVGVDPAPTLAENAYLHRRVHCTIDEFESDERFDVVTMRMVAEHVAEPERVVRSLARCTRAGGHVVVYTVHRFAPVPLLTALVPYGLHQPIKRVLWRTEAKDTFPTKFRMNTRRVLRRQLGEGGFEEAGFWHLDDCRTLARFRVGLLAELSLRAVLRWCRLRYPETCLLGVYRRR